MLSLAKLFSFNMRSCDAKQAYLQGKLKLGRGLRIRLPATQNGKGRACKTAKPIYVIIESDSLWLDVRLFAFHEEMQMIATLLDPRFLFKKGCERSIGRGYFGNCA